MPTLAKLARWLATKLAGAALIVGGALLVVGLWLFLRENIDFDRRRVERLQELRIEQAHLERVRGEVQRRVTELSTELQRQEQRVQQAQRVIATLQALESWWDRLWGNPEQQAKNAEQRAKMERLRDEAAGVAATLRRSVLEAGAEQRSVSEALARNEAEIARVEASKSQTLDYLHRAWTRARPWIVGALLAYFCGPTAWALTMYYGFGPLARRGRPIRFVDTLPALPEVGPSRVSLELDLRTGEQLHIREKFLQASDEGIEKRTRFVLDWRIPLTSLACGLVELVELRAARPGNSSRLTLSNSDDPHLELATIELPAGAALILRPSFLAGVITREDQSLRICRRWQIARWQAWIGGQFRYFEFQGPCRLIVSGSRGVRAERLVRWEDGRKRARRTNQGATIGFTPNLEYRPVPAETFWSYYRGMNPLFDDLFAGEGVFVLQETTRNEDTGKIARFWSGVWSGMLKVLGI